MKTYEGFRRGKQAAVVVYDDRTSGYYELDMRRDLRDLSPTLGWGFHGDPAGQTALAILADSIGPECALENCQLFKTDIISCLARDHWELAEITIRRWLVQQSEPSR